MEFFKITFLVSILIFSFRSVIAQFNSYSVFDNINITNQSAPQNEPSVKVSRVNINRVVSAWRDFRIGYEPVGILRTGFSYSTDGGITWAASKLLDSAILPNFPRCGDPVVTADAAGNFYISVLASNSIGNLTPIVYKSTDGGITFPNAYIVTTSNTEDKEWITCDISSASPYINNLYITWYRYTGTTGIKFSKSTNGGVNWSSAEQISNSGINEIAPGICTSRLGQIYICWLSLAAGSSSVKFDKSTDGGITFGSDVVVSTGPALTLTIGNVYTFPAIAVDNSTGPRSGWIYIVFADTRNGDYDVLMSRSTNAGVSWSVPARVNNDNTANGKLQIWPAIAVNETGNIAVMFIDTRNTPNNTVIECYMARSSDGGNTFTNELISTAQSPTNYPGSPGGAVRFGEYLGVDYVGNRVVSVWTDERAGSFDMEIYTADINAPIGIKQVSNNIPSRFEIGQNYPNPFNPVTNIKYQITNQVKRQNSNVKIIIFDMIGREIIKLVNEEQSAGTYEVDFSGYGYSSGIYFYSLVVDDIVIDTKKMMLIK